jgi:hypothetical protein
LQYGGLDALKVLALGVLFLSFSICFLPLFSQLFFFDPRPAFLKGSEGVFMLILKSYVTTNQEATSKNSRFPVTSRRWLTSIFRVAKQERLSSGQMGLKSSFLHFLGS